MGLWYLLGEKNSGRGSQYVGHQEKVRLVTGKKSESTAICIFLWCTITPFWPKKPVKKNEKTWGRRFFTVFFPF
jgi:hypothetical protein